MPKANQNTPEQVAPVESTDTTEDMTTDTTEDTAEVATPPAKEDKKKVEKELAKQEERVARQLRTQRKVRLVIPSGRGPHEKSPVPIGVNGREFLIVRDKEVLVPESIVEVLKLSVETVADVTLDDRGHETTTFRKALRFPFQVLGYEEAPAAGE